MLENKPITYFAPAERVSDEELNRQVSVVTNNQLLIKIINFMPFLVLVLNQQRQALFANLALLKLLDLPSSQTILGSRPGEIFHCEHSQDMTAGCGTSRFCRYCGAVKAIIDSGRLQQMVESNCTLVNFEMANIDLRVSAMPCEINNGEYYTLLMMQDISDNQRRGILEKVFFHDIRNLLSGLSLATQSEQRHFKDNENIKIISLLSGEIISEIDAQQQLLAAEDGNLHAEKQSLLSSKFVSDVVNLMEYHFKDQGKTIVIDKDSAEIVFMSDPHLLRRVLINMLKNAMEAAQPSDTVHIKTLCRNGRIDFIVHNPGCMSEEIQANLFKRSFSTKGKGRGIGTYSMRLLTEKYLDGKITFTSSPEAGTSFIASYPLALG